MRCLVSSEDHLLPWWIIFSRYQREGEFLFTNLLISDGCKRRSNNNNCLSGFHQVVCFNKFRRIQFSVFPTKETVPSSSVSPFTISTKSRETAEGYYWKQFPNRTSVFHLLVLLPVFLLKLRQPVLVFDGRRFQSLNTGIQTRRNGFPSL